MTAKDLLYLILDYCYLWQDKRDSPPAKARRTQIACLSEALGLTKKHVNPLVQVKYFFLGQKEERSRARHLEGLSDLDYLLKGEFLNDRPEQANSVLETQIRDTIDILFPDLSPDLRNKPAHIGWLFNHLLNFRQEVYKLAYPQSGMMEGFSPGLHYSFFLEGKLKKLITDNLSEIDDTLWLILDPLKRSFRKEEINFPAVDLDHLDHEWMMENY